MWEGVQSIALIESLDDLKHAQPTVYWDSVAALIEILVHQILVEGAQLDIHGSV